MRSALTTQQLFFGSVHASFDVLFGYGNVGCVQCGRFVEILRPIRITRGSTNAAGARHERGLF
jgi:hypothetical protein